MNENMNTFRIAKKNGKIRLELDGKKLYGVIDYNLKAEMSGIAVLAVRLPVLFPPEEDRDEEV